MDKDWICFEPKILVDNIIRSFACDLDDWGVGHKVGHDMNKLELESISF